MFNPADWIDRHPTVTSLVIIPLLTAAYSAIRAPRTPAQWAAMNPIEKTLLKIVSLSPFGWDPRQQIEALKQLRSGGYTTQEFVTAKRADYAQAKATADGAIVQVASTAIALSDEDSTIPPANVKSFRPAPVPADAPTKPEVNK